ncbi:helix-turn-helix domain-containing protein (plasmid) [Synechococcus elongatus PCC 11801]|uniref:Helix-turn-helix domain-containing protein n=1 Tax=Synechococcus elongatus PCC 11801 TaxID=2219813 RepID=A0ACD5A312_SYNEL
MARNKNLQAAKAEAIARIIAGEPYADIAKHLGIGISTLHSWRAKPDFRKAVEDGLSQIQQQTVIQITALNESAIAALKKVLEMPIEGTSITAGTAIRAAATVLSYGTQLRGEVGAERLSELEAGLNEVTERSDTVVPLSRAPKGWRFS